MKQLALYLPCCYPNETQFFNVLDLMEKYNVDILELGIPAFNPHMDGKIIKTSHKQVLDQGFNKTYFKRIVTKIKENYSFKIVLMTYKEGIEAYDLLTLGRDLVDGLLCVDKTIKIVDFHSPIQLYNEEMSDEMLQQQLNHNRLFAYCMSGVGKTGSFDHVPINYIDTMKRIKKLSQIPVFIGFGIKDKTDVESVYANGADGAIIGSYFVNVVLTSTPEQIENYIKELKAI
ncbi:MULTISPECIES: tryptophan synthase subunit alpha [Clostridia]|uniref:tryptophan synthase subunit alpha n=1 Tax=Clostridia TaxID=186801 RepID=UPI000EA29470|nr:MULTISPECIES: tryptophan synthase subunit alpha [Clostridia]NBJ69236.1 tryptophan synthase subunit alpha [Roseburia sp. 1XD42-34]RKI79205.1 tryptophan synthase subunit alpha [Clostridium sp. 1xD42-85]